MKSALVWLRRDLRVDDQTALAKATSEYERVHVVFVYDTVILDALPSRRDTRVTFIHQSVEDVAQSLGGRIDVLHGDPLDLIPEFVAKLGVQAVVAAHDDDPYALKRDAAVAGAMSAEFVTVKDHVVFERQEVLNSEGLPFKVFTPYRNAWMSKLTPRDIQERTPDLSRVAPAQSPNRPTLPDIGFEDAQPWILGGSKEARDRLNTFLSKIDDYKEHRDFPHPLSTSTLSADLRHGTVSIRELVRLAQSKNATKWLDELVWREFYHMILANFPRVVSEPFRPEFRNVQWPGNPSHFEPWKWGQTGYPLVDAAMRCLNATGWMHNRLRMVAAMFLTKDLLLDYRLGEEWFAEKLLDFELASNNGGWQWSASTGVDAQPWFRIFNPVLQSRKFDPGGAFIKTWCPELKDLDETTLHWPHDLTLMEQLAANCELGKDYPHPIVDHSVQRESALRFLELVSAKKG